MSLVHLFQFTLMRLLAIGHLNSKLIFLPMKLLTPWLFYTSVMLTDVFQLKNHYQPTILKSKK